MGHRGRLSSRWGRYTGLREPAVPGRLRVHLDRSVLASAMRSVRDPMCDYVEGAEWWITRSQRSVESLGRAFDRGDVACLLYERVGASLELGRAGEDYIVAMQLVLTGHDWDVDLCLEEIGVYVDELWDGTDVAVDVLTNPLEEEKVETWQ